MKLIVNRAALDEAMALINGVVPARTPKPILQGVKLTASGGKLTLQATDMDQAVTLEVGQVDVAEEGVVVAQAAKLAQIVHIGSDDTLTLQTEGEFLKVAESDAAYKIGTYPTDEYPPLPAESAATAFTIPAGEFKAVLERTVFAAAREMTRYAMNGVLLEHKGKRLTAVATDGHRLAKVTTDVAGEGEHKPLLPVKAVTLLLKMLADPEAAVAVTVAGTRVRFTMPGAVLDAAMLEGQFPPYDGVIPKEHRHTATVKREAMLSAVKRAALLTNAESKGVRLLFSKTRLIISSRAPEMGEAKIDMPVEHEGDEIAIELGMNPSYLMDALKVAPGEELRVEMTTPSKPAVLKAGAFIGVIMPVSLT